MNGKRTTLAALPALPSLVLCFSLFACEQAPLASHPGAGAERAVVMTVQANAASAVVEGLSVEVTGSGISVPIVANLTLASGLASGTVEVPAGGRRTFTMRAFDADAIETHRGSATVPIREGQNAAIAVVLEPLVGTAPIEGVIGTYTVEIDPTEASLAVGNTQAFSVTVRDVNEEPVEDPALAWGSLNPVVAAVDAEGLVTAQLAGETTVTASYRGFAAAAPVVVGGDAPPPNQSPVAQDDAAQTEEGVAGVIDVLANDSDPDGDALTVEGVTDPASGTAAINAENTVTYTPDEGFTGEDRFTYTVSDGHGATATAMVDVTVHAPVDCAQTVALGDGDEMQGRLPGVEITGDVTVTGLSTVCGDLTVSGGELDLNGHTVEVEGDLTKSGSGVIVMQVPGDLLRVVGEATFTGSMPAGMLTAGRMELQGRVTVHDEFRPSGTHTVVLNGTSQQDLSWECAYTNCGVDPDSDARFLNHVEFANPEGVHIGRFGPGAFDVHGNARITAGVVTGPSARVYLHGDLIEEFGGSWRHQHTMILGANPQLPASMTTRLHIGNPSTGRQPSSTLSMVLQNDLELTGDLIVEPGATLRLNGHALRVTGNLTTAEFGITAIGQTPAAGRIVMDVDADRLVVTGDAAFLAPQNVSMGAGARLSAGRFELGGNLRVQRNHFRGSGTHVTVFNGTTEQLVGMSQPFADVEIANTAGVRFFASPPWITGRLAILAGAAATFDISGTLDDALDLYGTLTTPDDRFSVRIGGTLFLRSTAVLNNQGGVIVDTCEKEDGYTINGVDPCP